MLLVVSSREFPVNGLFSASYTFTDDYQNGGMALMLRWTYLGAVFTLYFFDGFWGDKMLKTLI